MQVAHVPRASRPLRPAAPELPPMDALQGTHKDLLVVLGQLSDLLRTVQRDGLTADARAAARTVTRFIDETGRHHHAQEESNVFPTLLASGDVDLIQHVRRLQQDHGWLEEDWLELGPQLDALAHGIGGCDIDSLIQASEVFTDLYRDHIALEENIVYPAAKRLDLLQAKASQRL